MRSVWLIFVFVHPYSHRPPRWPRPVFQIVFKFHDVDTAAPTPLAQLRIPYYFQPKKKKKKKKRTRWQWPICLPWLLVIKYCTTKDSKSHLSFLCFNFHPLCFHFPHSLSYSLSVPSSMASSTPTNKEIEKELLPLIRVYKDGTVERLMSSPTVPPSPEDPETGVSSKDIVISNETNVSARIFLPKSHHRNHTQKLPIFVYFHAGAFCCESPFSFLCHRYLNILASQANVIAVSVDYRLLPHHPLPAAYEDGWNALQWIASHTTNNPINAEPWLLNHADFNKLYVGGDANGANLAHSLVMRAGTETLPGDVKILGAVLCCPYFWGSKPIGNEPVEGHENSLAIKVWNFVYPDAPGGIDNHRVNPCAPGAPSLATLGCSKMLVCVTGKDEFRDRDILYYESVKKSGWKGELEELFEADDDGAHGFQLFKPETENAKNLVKRLASFLV